MTPDCQDIGIIKKTEFVEKTQFSRYIDILHMTSLTEEL